MSLIIRHEEDEQRQMTVTVEVPEERVQKKMRQVARKVSRKVNIPGFRKGKAPYNIILRFFGEASLRQDAVDDLLQPVFQEALEEVAVEPYAQPQLNDMEVEPLVLKFLIPLEPKVTLGGYRSLTKEITAIEITEEAIGEALKQVQEKHQVVAPVERAVESGDLVTLGGEGRLKDEADEEKAIIFKEERLELVMEGDSTFFGEAFITPMIGASAGETVEFEMVFGEDFGDEELAGREATFTINIHEVKSRTLPALDDELAQEEGEFETLAELRASLADELERQATEKAKSDLLEEMVDDLLIDAEMVYPPAAINSEVDSMLKDYKQQVTQSGWDWDQFLTLQQMTEDKMREGWQERGEERLRRRIALQQFILDELLQVTPADLEAALDARIAAMGIDDEEMRVSMRQIFQGPGGAEMIANEVMIEKATERITAIRNGDAPDLAALKAAQEAEAAADAAAFLAAEEE